MKTAMFRIWAKENNVSLRSEIWFDVVDKTSGRHLFPARQTPGLGLTLGPVLHIFNGGHIETASAWNVTVAQLLATTETLEMFSPRDLHTTDIKAAALRYDEEHGSVIISTTRKAAGLPSIEEERAEA